MTDAPYGKMGPAAIVRRPAPPPEPRVERLLFLSTGHLTWATCQKIEERPHQFGWFSVYPVEYGFFGYANDERPDGMPDDLWACMAYARARGVDYIRWDCDESLIAALPDHSNTHP